MIGLEPSEAARWLTWKPVGERWVYGSRTLLKGGSKKAGINTPMAGCEWVEVPNTIWAYWAGEFGGFGKWVVGWGEDVATLKRRGFYVLEAEGWTGAMLTAAIVAGQQDMSLHGILAWGHGRPGYFYTVAEGPFENNVIYHSAYSLWHPYYHMGFGAIFACDSDTAAEAFSTSPHAVFWGKHGLLWPLGFHIYPPAISTVLPPGAQGTKQ